MLWKKELPLSLTQLATVKTAELLCKTFTVKKALKYSFIHNYGAFKDFEVLTETFRLQVTSQLEDVFLPLVLKKKLRSSIQILLDNLLSWLWQMALEVSKTERNWWSKVEKLIDNLSWTVFGEIDISKTFSKAYPAEPIQVDHLLWEQACGFCLEDQIFQWTPKMIEGPGSIFFDGAYLKDHPDSYYSPYFWISHRPALEMGYTHHRMMYWKLRKNRRRTKEDWALFIRHLKNSGSSDRYLIYNENNSICENMCKNSAATINISAMKYFWNRLNPEERSRSMMMEMAVIACEKDQHRLYHRNTAAIVVFLIQHMSLGQVDELLNNDLTSSIGRLPKYFGFDPRCERMAIISVLSSSTWQSLLPAVANAALDYFNKFEFNYVLQRFLQAAKREAAVNCDQDKLFDNFYRFWKDNPVHLKLNVDVRNWYSIGICIDKNFVPLLMHVIYDQDLYERRNMLIADFLSNCKDLGLLCRCQFMVIKTILVSRGQFLEKDLNIWLELLMTKN